MERPSNRRDPRRGRALSDVASRTHFAGVDFSGGRAAGRKIWMAQCHLDDGRLVVEACVRAESLSDSGTAPAQCLPALRRHLAELGPTVIGCDFPFTLPAALLGSFADWRTFVLDFPRRFSDADAFRAACLKATGGRELRRRCELTSRTPFCAYNLRLYRQTWAGIAGVLAPLVAAEAVSVLPFQSPHPLRPWLAEVCPASTLKRVGLYRPYKGRGEALHASRAGILTALEDQVLVPPELRPLALGDSEGDALDSMLAALAASGIDQSAAINGSDDIEGWVYC